MQQSTAESGNLSRKMISYREDDMKLEMELLRDLLLYVEERADRPHSNLEDIEVPPWGEDQIAYHVILAADEGLLKATIDKIPDDEDPVLVHVSYVIHRLTSRGHELLGNIREPTNWDSVKGAARKVGAVSLPIVFSIAEAFIKQRISQTLGIPSA